MFLRVTINSLLTMHICVTGCMSSPAPPEFEGTPPEVPLTYEPPPPTNTPAKENTDVRLVGKDIYPCKGHDACATPSPQDGTLKLAGAIPHSFDPCYVSDTTGQLIVDNLFEGLLVPGKESGRPMPGVAKSWKVSEDGRVYTFHLRENATWSNGRQVTSEDFRYAWMRVLKPESASSNASSFMHIQGARDFNRGKVKDVTKVGISAPNPTTLEVRLENPTPQFLEHVAQAQYAPVPSETVDEHGKAWIQSEHIVTNGAYHLSKWTHRVRVALEKRPSYWQSTKVKIPRILIHLGGDRSAGLTRYRQGEQHVVMDVSANLIPTFLKEARPDFFVDDSICYVDLIFNVKQPPFDSRKVRQAFAKAIDKERYVELLLGGLQAVADGPVPKLFAHSHNFPKSPGFTFDPEGARALLSQAGFPKGLDLPVITLLHNPSENHVRSATFVQTTLREHLNVKVQLRQVEHKSLLASLHKNDFQFARYARCHPNDPYPFLEEFQSESTHNHFNYRNETFDRLLKQSHEATTQPRRMSLLGQAERHIQNDVPHIPLYTGARSYLKLPVLRGWTPESGNRRLIRYMYWGDKE